MRISFFPLTVKHSYIANGLYWAIGKRVYKTKGVQYIYFELSLYKNLHDGSSSYTDY